MAFTKNTDDLNVIQKLPDEPNDVGGLTAAQLKAKFDEAGGKLKTSLNGLVDELGATTAAANIGFSSTTGVQGDNVQEAIENVQSQIKGISQGAVVDGSITTDKLDDDAVTTEKILDGAVTMEKIKGGLGWRKLTDDEFGLAAPDAGNLKVGYEFTMTIDYLEAYFNAPLGLVRFTAEIQISASNYSPTADDPDQWALEFSKHYKPYYSEEGVESAMRIHASDRAFVFPADGQASCRFSYAPMNDLAKANLAYYNGPNGEATLLILQLAERINYYGPAKYLAISGFYYTEDIPTETEGS